MNYTAIIPALALILQGCDQSNTSAEEWLQGSWVSISESCQSDAGISFYPKGRVATFGTEGIWNIDGNVINITNTEVADENMNFVPDNTKTKLEIQDKTSHSFKALYETGDVVEFKRCQTADELREKEAEEQIVEPEVSQKIIWEWTGGYSGNPFGQCGRMSENVNTYLAEGWKIVSSSAYERYVNNATCQGRDIVIEK